MIKLRTVQHTGTQFFKLLFREYGIPYNHKTLGRDEPDLPGDITVCTVRDPKLTYLSTKSRGRYDQSFHDGYKELNELWEQKDDNIYFIPIDQHDKAQQILNKINERLGLKLSTDWEPISSRRHKTNIEPIDLSTEYLLPVVKAFYEDWKPVPQQPGYSTSNQGAVKYEPPKAKTPEKTKPAKSKKKSKNQRTSTETRREVHNTKTESNTESHETVVRAIDLDQQ